MARRKRLRKRELLYALILVFSCCCPAWWISTAYYDAGDIHGWLPGYLSDHNREKNFGDLHEMWQRYDQSVLHRGEDFQTARLHVACGMCLWYWNLLSERDRKIMHDEAVAATSQVKYRPEDFNGDRMIYEMSRLTNLKWKRKMIKSYKMSDEDKERWAKRGEYFALNQAPE